MGDFIFKAILIIFSPLLTAIGVALYKWSKRKSKKGWWEPGYAKVVVPVLTCTTLLGFFLWLSPVGDRAEEVMFGPTLQTEARLVEIQNPEPMALVHSPFRVSGAIKGISSGDEEPKVWLAYRPVCPQKSYECRIFPQPNTSVFFDLASKEYKWSGVITVLSESVGDMPPEQANLDVFVIIADEQTDTDFKKYIDDLNRGDRKAGYMDEGYPKAKILKVQLIQ